MTMNKVRRVQPQWNMNVYRKISRLFRQFQYNTAIPGANYFAKTRRLQQRKFPAKYLA